MPVYRNEPIAVVDAYGAGQLLGAALRARGVVGVHVANRDCDWPQLSATLNPHDFRTCLDHRRDVVQTARQLRELGVRHVVAGTESGAVVADELAVELGTATANSHGVAQARRDKRLMHQLVFAAGVAVPWQEHFTGGDSCWVNGPVPAGPFVVKPPASAGTDAVTVVPDQAAALAAVEAIRIRSNLYGEPNDGAVIQEYLRGTEFMVNTVSAGGTHCFIDIWSSHKRTRDGEVVYDKQLLIDADGAEGRRIRAYVIQVLDALGVRYGPSHTEVVLTDRGPLLLETATRMPGGADPALTLRTLGTSQAGETIDALLAPDVVRDRGETRRLRCAAMGVSLISPASGRLDHAPDLGQLTELASFHGIRTSLTAGSRVQRTVDLLTKPGGLYLCHKDPEQVLMDYQRVRHWEATELAAAIVQEPDDV